VVSQSRSRTSGGESIAVPIIQFKKSGE